MKLINGSKLEFRQFLSEFFLAKELVPVELFHSNFNKGILCIAKKVSLPDCLYTVIPLNPQVSSSVELKITPMSSS